jgi:hypothetical protein
MQIRLAIAAALWIVTFAGGWYFGALSGRLGKANAEQRATADRLKDVLDGQKDAADRAKKLQKALDRLPKAETKQRDLVRTNPAGCDRPAAVADGLQDARNKANAARALPSDS